MGEQRVQLCVSISVWGPWKPTALGQFTLNHSLGANLSAVISLGPRCIRNPSVQDLMSAYCVYACLFWLLTKLTKFTSKRLEVISLRVNGQLWLMVCFDEWLTLTKHYPFWSPAFTYTSKEHSVSRARNLFGWYNCMHLLYEIWQCIKQEGNELQWSPMWTRTPVPQFIISFPWLTSLAGISYHKLESSRYL